MKEFESLNQLNLKECGIVKKIHATDKVKRRFLDLGIIPSTKVQLLYESPFHNPKAYSIRGAVIALRNEDAELIEIHRLGDILWD